MGGMMGGGMMGGGTMGGGMMGAINVQPEKIISAELIVTNRMKRI